MKVFELIEKLSNVENKNLEVFGYEDGIRHPICMIDENCDAVDLNLEIEANFSNK